MKNLLDFIYTKKIIFAIFMVTILAVLISKPISASTLYQLDVSYTNGSIASGPLSFGLSELPTSVTANFILDSGTVGLNAIYFYASDVISANVTFGDATWTESLLDNFSMSISSGNVSSLSYAFLPTTSATVEGPIILNFPLSITGTDISSGEAINYGYIESAQTVTTVVPIPAAVWLFGSGLLGLIGIAKRKKA